MFRLVLGKLIDIIDWYVLRHYPRTVCAHHDTSSLAMEQGKQMSSYSVAVRISPNMTSYVAAVFEIPESCLTALSPTAVIVYIR